MAEEEGFEPPRALTPLSVFKTDPFSRAWVFLRIRQVISYHAYSIASTIIFKFFFPTIKKAPTIVHDQGRGLDSCRIREIGIGRREKYDQQTKRDRRRDDQCIGTYFGIAETEFTSFGLIQIIRLLRFGQYTIRKGVRSHVILHLTYGVRGYCNGPHVYRCNHYGQWV